MDGISTNERFISAPNNLFEKLITTVNWDARMASRKTASYGVAYNYSQISYPFQPMLPELQVLADQISIALGFMPNNCLINLYADGKSKMGYHSDQTDILADGTGVAIVSLGAPRILRFRSIADNAHTEDFLLSSGSLFYMTQDVQHKWQHCLPPADTDQARMSLTFRKISEHIIKI